jgi:hypothetical protein
MHLPWTSGSCWRWGGVTGRRSGNTGGRYAGSRGRSSLRCEGRCGRSSSVRIKSTSGIAWRRCSYGYGGMRWSTVGDRRSWSCSCVRRRRPRIERPSYLTEEQRREQRGIDDRGEAERAGSPIVHLHRAGWPLGRRLEMKQASHVIHLQ